MDSKRPTVVAVLGLGYVGLALATVLARSFRCIGIDIDPRRVSELQEGYDRNSLLGSEVLHQEALTFTTEHENLSDANIMVIAVPTPVDTANVPDLTSLVSACKVIGGYLNSGDIVVLESTVYPGCTDEVCIPILEETSGLTGHSDFGVGYSPERIDPGDPSHGLTSVMKVVSAGDPATLDVISGMYEMVIPAGVYRAPDIRTAEAAKVIENIQRDLNIALMNELSILFRKMGLNTTDVLSAAQTKWNFARYYPGLVGGHCIPVDPFYLVHKARKVGYDPEVILAGRRMNDSMAEYVVRESLEQLEELHGHVASAKALVMGLTFKEDIPDTRNAQSAVIVEELVRSGLEVWYCDPLLTAKADDKFFLEDPFDADERFQLVILAVPHSQYKAIPPEEFLSLLAEAPLPSVFADLRGILTPNNFDQSHTRYWRL